MDDDCGLGIRNWGYYEQTLKGNLGLQLMPSVPERDQKPTLAARDSPMIVNGGYFHRECGIPEPSMPMDFVRDSWIAQRFSIHQNSYSVLAEASTAHTMQMPTLPEMPKEERAVQIEEPEGAREGPLKKRANGRACRPPKPKKSKRIPKDESNSSASRSSSGKRSTEVVINGMDTDISGIPIPVCSCTGMPQQCYRWGCGGWQSACCTTNMSVYPLPMNNKRRGARIAGRKMSQGAFKKVLEKLVAEGYNFSNPIDLKNYWAKHGTNKFVTIR
ncbi:Protein BASIC PENTACYSTEINE2-like [Asimina triloba]